VEPLVSLEEFQRRVPAAVEDSDRALAALEDTSALVRAEAGKTWEGEDPPAEIVALVVMVAQRAFANPSQASQVSIGSFSRSFRTAFLTADERAAVRRAGGVADFGGLWTVETTRGDIETRRVRQGVPAGDVDAWQIVEEGTED
jgi:hypothetical protein